MIDVYSYGKRILEKFPDLKERLRSGTIIPHQVEIHPPPKGKDLCWLRCKHCYTQTDLGQEQRISGDKLVEIIKEISDGSPKTAEKPEKIIFSGFRTDPLNSHTLVDIIRASKDGGFVIGIHTKGLVLNEEIIATLTERNQNGDYISFSIDAGDNQTYNSIHGVRNPQARLYDCVVENVGRLMKQVRKTASNLKVRTTYWLTNENFGDQVRYFVRTFSEIGVHTIRFSLPIFPTMGSQTRQSEFPQISEGDLKSFKKIFEELSRTYGQLLYFPYKENPERTLPCYCRWMLPTIGFDGYLYPCCVVASKEFETIRMGDLKKEGFWETYYRSVNLNHDAANCQCDNKEMEVNRMIHSHLKRL